MDIVTLGTALKGAKAYTDATIAPLLGGVHYRGSVNYFNNLPSNPSEGDAYTVKYSGTSGTSPDGTEYVWALDTEDNTYKWIGFSPDTYTKAEVDNLLSGKQSTIDTIHKLSADLVDDTNTTNKFTNATEKEAWNNKQDALTFDNSPTENSNNPVKSGGVYTALDGKVDKVNGKGLSTEDYTTDEKSKLANIAAGAEVNVQSDWNQSNNEADDYIKNKPTIPTAYTSTPAMDGVGNAGNSTSWAKGDHVHPSDTSKQNEVLGSWTAGSATTHQTPAGTDTVLQALQKIDNNQRNDESNISTNERLGYLQNYNLSPILGGIRNDVGIIDRKECFLSAGTYYVSWRGLGRSTETATMTFYDYNDTSVGQATITNSTTRTEVSVTLTDDCETIELRNDSNFTNSIRQVMITEMANQSYVPYAPSNAELYITIDNINTVLEGVL